MKPLDHLITLIFLAFSFSDLLIHPNRFHMTGVLHEIQYYGKTVERKTGDYAYCVQLLVLEMCENVRQKMIFHKRFLCASFTNSQLESRFLQHI